MKQTILVFAILLSALTTSFAQSTTLRIYNNIGCDVLANVNETDITCSSIFSFGLITVPAFSFVDVRSNNTGAEFEVEIVGWGGAWLIPPVYTDNVNCTPQVNSSTPSLICATAGPLAVGTSTVIAPPFPPVSGIDKQVNVTW